MYGSDAYTPMHVRPSYRERMTFDAINEFADKLINDLLADGIKRNQEEADKMKYFIGDELLKMSNRSDLVENAPRLAEMITDDIATELEWDRRTN